jgi:hypothetical protein
MHKMMAGYDADPLRPGLHQGVQEAMMKKHQPLSGNPDVDFRVPDTKKMAQHLVGLSGSSSILLVRAPCYKRSPGEDEPWSKGVSAALDFVFPSWVWAATTSGGAWI